MTVLSRSVRVRRSGRRPGWLLLTALLVLAIASSSALVFTNRVELLKLAVILALWAAVVAAFVSVIYRRQSDLDQAKARDLKLVYDLQLDREISARREYELTVESQLRHELASELRAQAADEVAALRAELAALRANLEALFDTELNQRPALENERTAVRGYSDWDHDGHSTPADWVASNRITAARQAGMSSPTEEISIIDVPEVGVPPAAEGYDAGAYQAAEEYQRQEYRGAHWRDPDSGDWRADGRSEEDGSWPAEEQGAPQSQQQASTQGEAPPPQPAPEFEPPHESRHLQPEQPQPEWRPEPLDQETSWHPIEAEGQWLPAGTAGSNWVSTSSANSDDLIGAASNADGSTAVNQPTPPAPPSERGARHSSSADSAARRRGETETGRQLDKAGRRRRARHSTENGNDGAGAEATSPPPPAPPSPPASPPTPAAGDTSLPPEPAARHRSVDQSPDESAPQTGGQSVADLLARLAAEPTGGGRRRRRED